MGQAASLLGSSTLGFGMLLQQKVLLSSLCTPGDGDFQPHGAVSHQMSTPPLWQPVGCAEDRSMSEIPHFPGGYPGKTSQLICDPQPKNPRKNCLL